MNKYFIFGLHLLISIISSSCFQEKKPEEPIDPVQQKLDSFESFKITDVSPGGRYFLHQSGQGKSMSNCEISKQSVQSGTIPVINCWLEAQELDLGLSGVKLKVQVPSDICERIEVRPYWFWNFRPGKSYKTYSTFTEYGECTTCNGVSCTGGEASALDYDWSSIENYPNCDFGHNIRNEYEMTNKASAACTGSSPISTMEYSSAKIEDCISGVGINFRKDANGIPISEIYEGNLGLEKEFDFTHPAGKDGNFIPLVYYSNYIHQCKDNSYDYPINNVLNYVNQTGGDNNSPTDPFKKFANYFGLTPNPYYTFSCLDNAYEHKATIHIQIRAWDRKFGLGDNLDQTLPDLYYDPNEETGDINGPYNDFNDWTSLGTSTNIDCSNDPTSSGFLFPNIIFKSSTE